MINIINAMLSFITSNKYIFKKHETNIINISANNDIILLNFNNMIMNYAIIGNFFVIK